MEALLRSTAHFLINPYHQLFLLLILLLAALLLKKYRLSKNFATLLILWWLSILLPVYEQLIYQEERQWIPLELSEEVKSLNHILVLGGGKVSDPFLSKTAQLNVPQLSRIAEGLRIYHYLD